MPDAELHLFIDTNIYLGLYELSKDSVEDADQLVIALKKSELQLWLTECVKREYWANRSERVFKPIDEFARAQDPRAPPLVRLDSMWEDYCRSQKETTKLRAKIVEEVRKELDEETTRIDHVVNGLFSIAKTINSDEYQVDAQFRASCGLPPGKKNGLGDRLNWVSLLHSIPEESELCIVSDDGDFAHNDFIKPYLANEWKRKTKGEIKLYKNLNAFLAERIPDAKEALIREKELRVDRFCDSSTFQETHERLSALREIDDFSSDQIAQIVAAYLDNTQINWIQDDLDVKAFAERINQRLADHIPRSNEFRDLFDTHEP
ncbi:MAG: PIN domain-containing protein [Myxococcota bacterium]